MQDYKPTPEDLREREQWLAVQAARRQAQRRALLSQLARSNRHA